MNFFSKFSLFYHPSGWALFAALFALTSPLCAKEDTLPLQKPSCVAYPLESWSTGWDIEARTAYFLPSSDLVRDTYKGARMDWELEASKAIADRWHLWANFTYFSKDGTTSSALDLDSTLTMYPVSLGIKYVYPISCPFSVYGGLGINGTWLRYRSEEINGTEHVDKWRMGATAKMGAYYEIGKSFFADVFVDYLYIPMELRNVDNLGGFRFGIGIGFHL